MTIQQFYIFMQQFPNIQQKLVSNDSVIQMFLLETDQQDSISFKQFKNLVKKIALYRSTLVAEDKDKSRN